LCENQLKKVILNVFVFIILISNVFMIMIIIKDK